MRDLLLAVAAYFLGTLPSAYLCGRLLKRLDIRQVGSGNVGAMNTIKQVGYMPGVLTLMADVAKGALAVHLAAQYGVWPSLPLLAAFLAVLGHNFNLFLRFKGGKGLACLAGSLLLLSPAAIFYVFIFIGIIALFIRDTNTAAGVGIFSLPFVLALQKGEWTWCCAGAALSLIIAAKHHRDFLAYRLGRRKLV